mgnify:CR=1 FL=1
MRGVISYDVSVDMPLVCLSRGALQYSRSGAGNPWR